MNTFKDSEKRSRWLKFFQHNIPMVGCIDNHIMIVFNVSDRYMLPWMRGESRMTVIITLAVLNHSLLRDVQHLIAKVSVIACLKRHFEGSTLKMTFQNERILNVDLSLKVRLCEKLIRMIHEMLIYWIRVSDQNGQRIFLPSTSPPTLLTLEISRDTKLKRTKAEIVYGNPTIKTASENEKLEISQSVSLT